MKYLVVLFLLTSCSQAPVVEKKKPFIYRTIQEKVIDCYKLLKRLGEDGEQAGSFCSKIYQG